jgi:transcription elongation factor GreA
MHAIDRFVVNNTFIEVDLSTWLTKATDALHLGHITVVEKQDLLSKKKHRFSFLIATYGDTTTDPDSGIECLPHNAPLAAAIIGLRPLTPTRVRLPAGEALLTLLSIRNPTPEELQRLLPPLAPLVEGIQESNSACP